MFINDDKIEEIRSASDIVDVVSDYVRLKKRGSNFVGLCPFHSEKTPSFNVNPGMQIYKCFGCGQGGDVYQFVKTVEHLEFPDTVRLLAERAGISLPESDQNESQDQASENIYAALRFANSVFTSRLEKQKDGDAYSYLVNERGFSEETLAKFEVGLAADSWDSLLKSARSGSISPESLHDAGLVVKKDNGSFYDRYRNRIIFPIHNAVGKIVGFGGRVLKGDSDGAKYINSPETEVYHKSEILYGLFQSKRSIRAKEEALLVEGYTDVMALHQAGIENVIASSGTSLTDQQVGLIKRYCKKLVMLFDGDAAGIKATIRGIEVALKRGVAPYVVSLPNGEDPDTYIRSTGAVDFERYVDSAQVDFIAFAYSILKADGVFETPEGTAAGQRRIIKLVSHVKDDLIRDAYVARAAEVIGLPEFRIHEEMKSVGGGSRQRQRRKPEMQSDQHGPRSHANDPQRNKGPLPQEKALIRLMIVGGQSMIELILGNMALDEFSDGPARETVSYLLQMYEAGSINNKRLLDGTAGDAVRDLASEVMVSENEPSQNWERMHTIPVPRLDEDARASALSSMTYLKLVRVKEAIDHLNNQIYVTSQNGEDVRQLQEELQALFAARKKIENGDFLVEH